MSGNASCKIVLLLVVLGTIAVTGIAGAATWATGEVSVVGDYKIYAYTLWNNEGSAEWFDIGMPEEGARAVIEAWCSHVSGHGSADLNGEGSYWGWSSFGVRDDESLTFYLKTPASVPTSYSWATHQSVTNWTVIVYPVDIPIDDEGYRGEFRWGDSVLPVPVPEPSSLAAMTLAASGMGVGLLRRKRR